MMAESQPDQSLEPDQSLKLVVKQAEAIGQIQRSLKDIYHIHGTSDRIFPMRFVKANFVIAKSGHFMIMNRAAEVSELLQKIIS